ncbi:MAG: antiviral reverse transcriptase Drt3b [Sulfuricurvum sp.]|nr:antiviral reverse transcriptase Drt3b [Sulfuricurvum sp.]MDP3023538.1 antiviral reverse transcriptase Drt3b [Sulfuricurvum sp.]
MKTEKIFVNKNDHSRVLLTDLLPYEVPLIFSNEGFYYLLTNKYEPLPTYIKDTVLKLNQKPIMKDIPYTIPFNYKIKKHLESFRTLSIIHPSLQNYFIDFYKQYDQIMLSQCDKSPFSLRKPTKIANAYYEKMLLSDREMEDQIEVSRNGFSKQPEYASSYFLYSKYSFMHKFFSSYEMNRLEKKFAYMMSLDISKCFYNIYTHSLCWAVKEKSYSKSNAGKRTFENLFDTLMQKSNYNETNGIVVGPEISRIFAEIIFQDIDLNVLKVLKEHQLEHKVHYDIKRYVDDYFIYSNNKNTLELIHKILEEKLEEYKLYLNASKTNIHSPPFISDISIAKIEISQLFERSVGPFIEIDHLGKKVEFKKLNAYYSKSNYFISEIKKILKQNHLKYEDISSYLFSIFKKRLVQIFNPKYQYEINFQNIEEFFLYILDILFFLYSLAIRVNTTYTISHMLLTINKVIEQLPNGKKNNIRKKIYDEIIFVIKKWCHIDQEISLEILNLLIVLRGLGDHFRIPEEQLRDILNLETVIQLNYFQIISLLYYIADDERYKNLKSEIIDYVIDIYKNNEKKDFLEAELSLLLLDFLSCPFVAYKKKNYLMSLLISDPVEKKEVLEYVIKYQWFTNWSDISIEKLLLKKELKFGYEK